MKKKAKQLILPSYIDPKIRVEMFKPFYPIFVVYEYNKNPDGSVKAEFHDKNLSVLLSYDLLTNTYSHVLKPLISKNEMHKFIIKHNSKQRGKGKVARKSKKRASTLTLPKGIEFVRGSGTKKYTAIFSNGKKVHFGDKRYEHYKDSVPKRLGGKIWSHKDHLDDNRRKNYRKRHGGVLTKDGRKAFKVKYSPSWFSYYFLW